MICLPSRMRFDMMILREIIDVFGYFGMFFFGV
jgi:hypothetical protein